MSNPASTGNTFLSIVNEMKPKKATKSAKEVLEKWKIDFTNSIMLENNYKNFDLKDLKMIVLGTSGLEPYNSALAFVSDNANPEKVPFAVQRFIKLIYKALTDNELKKANWENYDYQCKESKKAVLFLNVCLGTNSNEDERAYCSVAFVNALLAELKDQKVIILDMRMSKNVHVDDLKVCLKKEFAEFIKPVAENFVGGNLTGASSENKNNSLATLHKLYEKLKEEVAKSETNISDLRNLETQIQEQFENYYIGENLGGGRGRNRGQPSANPNCRLEQDQEAYVLGKYSNDVRAKIIIPADGNVDYHRLGNPGTHSYLRNDEEYIVGILKRVQNKNSLIGQLYKY